MRLPPNDPATLHHSAHAHAHDGVHDRKAIHFGAGNIGRGFIGPLLVDSGYHVIFADVDKDVIRALNEQDSYAVHILDSDEEHLNAVHDVSGLLATSAPDIARAFVDPYLDLATTAVGVSVLPRIASVLADGMRARRAADAGDMNVIACENAALEDDPETAAWVRAHVGFANCSVDRIVPPYHPNASAGDSPLDVGVEGFYEWVVDGHALHATRPAVHLKGVRLTDKLDAYVERKLFTLNCGHALAAYLGALKRLATIDAAVADADVRGTLRGALEREAGAALVRKHGFDPREHRTYVERVVARFANARVRDDVGRVGREPLRKLARGDRLLGPYAMARGYGLPTENLATGIAAAFLYDVPEDAQSKELQRRLKDGGASKVVAEVTEYEVGSDEHREIVGAYEELQRKYRQ
ncbi:mannitol dehydrogenase domain-containing protein [Epithele typhae]|uniref:mannitol dehydrogenase domain-containing protein n=1 Tax=Epithele typhae TaxID=378194 RepID=UPI002007880B|nr:mannitol dehydrogenase domain-containing protein [Epithele typhae]KAH9933231.1 mannitol dehydrogenase domain-containing protein [Epithele typhae]